MELNQNKAPESGGSADQPKTNEEWLWQGRIEYGEHVRQTVENELARWDKSAAAAAVIVGNEMIKQVIQPMVREVVTMIFSEASKSSDRFFGLERMSTIVIDGRGSGGEVKINKDVARAASQKIIFMNSSRSANGGGK